IAVPACDLDRATVRDPIDVLQPVQVRAHRRVTRRGHGEFLAHGRRMKSYRQAARLASLAAVAVWLGRRAPADERAMAGAGRDGTALGTGQIARAGVRAAHAAARIARRARERAAAVVAVAAVDRATRAGAGAVDRAARAVALDVAACVRRRARDRARRAARAR